MRRLTKGPEPGVLVEKAASWTEEYLRDRASGESAKARWSHTEVRDSLRSETYEKCAYCESEVDSVAWPHVEHIRPKSKFPNLVLAWENLTLACPRCNQNKGSYDEVTQPLLNPYEDEPDEHLQFLAGFVRVRDGSTRGEVTIRVLKLHRGAIAARRLQRIEQVELLVQAWHRAPVGLKEVLCEQVWEESQPGNEYTAAVTQYLRLIKFPEPGADKMVGPSGHS